MKIPFERFRRDLLGALAAAAVLLLAAGVPPAARAQGVAPDEFIKKVSTEVLDQIRADKDIQSGNPRRISDFVDKTVMPQINFERMTSLAVGRAWREATPEQRSKLTAEFRTLLLRTPPSPRKQLPLDTNLGYTAPKGNTHANTNLQEGDSFHQFLSKSVFSAESTLKHGTIGANRISI